MNRVATEVELAMEREFEGLRAIVTGGASGIGAAVVSVLRERGARVVVADLADPVSQLAAGSLAVRCDVADDESVRSAVDSAVAQMGGLDILVNNAGIGAQGDVEANDDQEWHRVYDVNVVGVVRVSRAALPYLRRSEHAVIVNTCSVVAHVGLPNRVLYSATKGAVLSLTLAMAADCLPSSVRVNCVSPGTADTPWIDRLMDSAADPVAERQALEARQPSGRLVQPREIAAAIALLASPQAASITGTNLTIDGGLQSLRLPPRSG